MSLDNLYFTLSPKFNLQNSLWLASIHPLRRDFFFSSRAEKKQKLSSVLTKWMRVWAVGDRGERRGETAVSVNEWDKRHGSEDGEEDGNSSIQGFRHNCRFLYRRRQSFKAAKQDLWSNSLVIIQHDSKRCSRRSGWVMDSLCLRSVPHLKISPTKNKRKQSLWFSRDSDEGSDSTACAGDATMHESKARGWTWAGQHSNAARYIWFVMAEMAYSENHASPHTQAHE